MNDPKDALETLGSQLAAWREFVRRLPEEAAAEELGIPLAQYRAMERGDPATPLALWLTAWKAMGVLEDVLHAAVPGADIVSAVGEALMAELEKSAPTG